MPVQPFHLAFPVDDLDAARAFYGGLLGCAEGRSADHWIANVRVADPRRRVTRDPARHVDAQGSRAER